jgi:hypothetical protein
MGTKAFSYISARLLFRPLFQCVSAALSFFMSAHLLHQWLRIRNIFFDGLTCALL